MSGVSLFDVLNKRDPAAGSQQSPDAVRLGDFARQLIDSSLADLNRLKVYDGQISPCSVADPERRLELLCCVWKLFAEWADEAERVLDRANTVVPIDNDLKSSIDQLFDAIGRTRARLSVTPEATARAIADMKAGRTIPVDIQKLRDEIRSRVRG